jgi:hypothetical protein
MKNADLVKSFPQRAAKRAELAAAKRAITAAAKKAEKLDAELRELDKITEIADGIALRRGEGGWIEAVGDDIRRCAQIYPNAHNSGKTYGLYTYTDSFGRAGERWHGFNFSKAEAEQLALTWVLRGIRQAR